MDQLKAVEVCIDSYDLRMHEMKVYFNEFLGQADFTGIAQANAIPIIFEAGQTSTTVTVPITNDNRVEGDEQFFGQIISGGGIPNIEIFAPTATVDIVDDDCKCNYMMCLILSLYDSFSSIPLPPVIIIVPIFGFESSSYSFDESVGIGMVAVTLDADSGQLSENLVFTFSTQDGTAEGEFHKLVMQWLFI